MHKATWGNVFNDIDVSGIWKSTGLHSKEIANLGKSVKNMVSTKEIEPQHLFRNKYNHFD